MGAFFTNIQLQTSGIDPSTLTDMITDCIVRLNAEAGLMRTDSEEDADKSVIISPSEDLTWISIYDEDTHDISKLNELASGLSKELRINALSVLVSDSDSVYVGIHVNGILEDSISNVEEEMRSGKSKPLAWSAVLAGNYLFEDIISAWQNKFVFAEDFLARFAPLINLDAENLLTGYDYLSKQKPANGIKLHFVQRYKKKAATLGPTKLSMVAGTELVDVKSGETQTTEWIISNEGGSSTGLEIIVAGECIENERLIPGTAQVSLFRSQSGIQDERAISFTETTSTTGEKIFYARIEDIIIPESFQPTFPMSPKESERYSTIRYDCAIKCNISFTGDKEGAGEFTISFCPLVNEQEGAYAATLMKGGLEDWLKKNGL